MGPVIMIPRKEAALVLVQGTKPCHWRGIVASLSFVLDTIKSGQK
jgi:hypothetical protein